MILRRHRLWHVVGAGLALALFSSGASASIELAPRFAAAGAVVGTYILLEGVSRCSVASYKRQFLGGIAVRLCHPPPLLSYHLSADLSSVISFCL